MPIAAVAGRREILERLAPLGPVYQAGTLSGNPLATAAGLATLRELRERSIFDRLELLGSTLEQGIRGRIAGLGHRVCVNRVGSMFTLFLGVDQVRTVAEARAADTAAYGRYFHAMLARGFYLPPSQFETLFLSAAHTEDDIAAFCDGAVACLREAF
jgi:glutamate-1-semialdehyde 2,1-aminomutase